MIYKQAEEPERQFSRDQLIVAEAEEAVTTTQLKDQEQYLIGNTFPTDGEIAEFPPPPCSM